MTSELEDIIKGMSKNQIAHLFIRAILRTGYFHPYASYWLVSNLSLVRFLDILEAEVTLRQKPVTAKSNLRLKRIIGQLDNIFEELNNIFEELNNE